MTKNSMYTDSVSHDQERMLKYKTFAVSFSYPDDSFFDFLPEMSSKKEKMMADYDKLFRAKEIWLYGTEYTAKNEFQRTNYMSDIMGFYKAFGIEPDRERADALPNELEFMYYLILKRLYALEKENIENREDKASVCVDAQKKFFAEHLYPAAKQMAEKIIEKSEDNFYVEKSNEMIDFLETEKSFLKEYL